MQKIDLTTDKKLLNKINKAMKKGISKTDIENQRISIIFAGMPKDSEITKEQIKALVR